MGSAARDAQPALLQHLDETNRFVRITIELALGRQQAYSDMLVPRLVKELEEDLAAGRFYPSRVEALGAFGVQAKEAVPVLLQILSKQQDETHVIADALKRIDPEAATKAGVK